MIQRRIGRGGMATVYKAQHRHLGTWHAIKVLDVAARSVHERLLREGRMQAALQHPNVVSVTDVVEVDGSLALVLEYIRGPTLRELLQAQRLSDAQADALARGILRGVHAAHRKGFVHRDLKPANILLQPTDHGFTPKVADFGLAKLLQTRSDGDGTRTGANMGTPQYMSPEQIRDAKDVDLRSDIFALGAILFEMVTGKRAFDGADVVEIYNAVTQGWRADVRDLRPDLPERMVHAIDGALQIPPEARFQDCEALATAWDGRQTRAPDSVPDIANDAVWNADVVAALTPDHHDASVAEPLAASEANATFFASELTHGSIADEEPPTNPTVLPPDPSQASDAAASDDGDARGVPWLPWVVAVGALSVALVAVWMRPTPAPVLPIAMPEAGNEALVPPTTEADEAPALAEPVRTDAIPEADLLAPTPEAPAARPEPAAPKARTEPVRPKPRPKPAPAPKEEADPVEVATEPLPTAAATEAPAPAPPNDALVNLTGPAPAVWLRGDQNSFKVTTARRVPPGRYTVVLDIEGDATVVGDLRLAEGDTLTLRCDDIAVRCKW